MKNILLVLILIGIIIYGCDKQNNPIGTDRPSLRQVGNIELIMEWGWCDSITCYGISEVIFIQPIYTVPSNIFFLVPPEYRMVAGRWVPCNRSYIYYNTIAECYYNLGEGEVYFNGQGEIDLHLFFETCYEIEYGINE